MSNDENLQGKTMNIDEINNSKIHCIIAETIAREVITGADVSGKPKQIDSQTPVSTIIEAIGTLLSRLTQAVVNQCKQEGLTVPIDIAHLVRSAVWPEISDEQPLNVVPLEILEKRVDEIEQSILAISELLRRLLTNRAEPVRSVSTTSHHTKFVRNPVSPSS